MQEFTTELEKEYYILTPINVGGELTNKGEKLHFKDGLKIETFIDKEDYTSRCEELGIENEENKKQLN